MPTIRLDYKNPFELLAHLTVVAKGVVEGRLLICDPGSYRFERSTPTGDYYAVTPDDMLYVAFIVGHLWESYQKGDREFFLHAKNEEDLVYFKLKLDAPKADNIKLPA